MTRVGDKTPLFISVLTTHKDSVRIGIGYPDPSTSGKPNASSGSRRYAKAPTPSQSIRPGLGTCTRHGSQLVIIPAGPAGFGEVQLVCAFNESPAGVRIFVLLKKALPGSEFFCAFNESPAVVRIFLYF